MKFSRNGFSQLNLKTCNKGMLYHGLCICTGRSSTIFSEWINVRTYSHHIQKLSTYISMYSHFVHFFVRNFMLNIGILIKGAIKFSLNALGTDMKTQKSKKMSFRLFYFLFFLEIIL